jgi:hypothetical protein
MSLSKAQIEERDKYKTFLFIHERDLLECARRYPAWKTKAHELGFSEEAINKPWTHPDEGRRIKYMRIDEVNV